MSNNPFWAAVDVQLTELREATTAAAVLSILSQDRNPYGNMSNGGGGFFAGDASDAWLALRAAGWSFVWCRADYYWCMAAPNGASQVTYVEGDVYRGDRR